MSEDIRAGTAAGLLADRLGIFLWQAEENLRLAETRGLRSSQPGIHKLYRRSDIEALIEQIKRSYHR